jgi:hypothetical protein
MTTPLLLAFCDLACELKMGWTYTMLLALLMGKLLGVLAHRCVCWAQLRAFLCFPVGSNLSGCAGCAGSPLCLIVLSVCLQEMLAPVKASADKSGLHETFVTDLADQCYRCAAGVGNTVMTQHNIECRSMCRDAIVSGTDTPGIGHMAGPEMRC